MNEETRRAGACERSREFAGYMPGFSDARYHHAALASEQEFDGAGEVVIELSGQASNSVGFNFEHGASQRKCPVAIDFRYHARSISKAPLCRAGRRPPGFTRRRFRAHPPTQVGLPVVLASSRRLDETDPQSNDQRGFQTDDFS